MMEHSEITKDAKMIAQGLFQDGHVLVELLQLLPSVQRSVGIMFLLKVNNVKIGIPLLQMGMDVQLVV